MAKKKETKKLKIKSQKSKKVEQALIEQVPQWDLFDVLESMDRLFMDTPSWMPPWWNRYMTRRPWSGGLMEPDKKITPLDLVDLGKEYKIIAEMPGILKQDIDINISSTSIRICGETKTDLEEEHDDYLRRERSYSTLCRNLHFPEEVNPENAEASLRDGILEIIIPKKKPSAPGRKIPVK